MTFPDWWQRLRYLAAHQNWPLPDDPDSFRDYFEDGDSPEVALAMEQKCAAGEMH